MQRTVSVTRGIKDPKRGTSLRIWLPFLPAAIVVFGLFAVGLVFAVVQSLGFFPPLEEHSFTVVHYSSLVSDRELWDSLLLTVRLSLISTVLSAALGVAFAIALRELVGRSPFTALLMQMPVAIPHLAVGIVVISLLAPSGLIARIFFRLGAIHSSTEFPVLVNDRLGIGLIAAYVIKEAPFIALMTYAVLVRIGKEYEEMARTLGASRWQGFRYVILPLTAPTVTSSSLLVLAYTLGAFELPFLLGRSYPTMLSVVAQRRFMGVSLDQRPSAIALAVILAGASALITWIYGRVAGLVTGSEKPMIF